MDCSLKQALWLWWDPDWSKAERDHAGTGTGDQTAPGDRNRTGEDAAGWRASLWEGMRLQSASSSALVSFKSFPSWYQQACLLSNLQIRNAAEVTTNASRAPNCAMVWVVLLGLVSPRLLKLPVMTLEARNVSPPRMEEEVLCLPFAFLFTFSP